MSKKLSIILTLSAIALLALMIFGFNVIYTPSGPTTGWQSIPLTIYVDSRGLPSIEDADHGVTATRTALESTAAWNGAVPGILNTALTSGSARSTDGLATIDFHSPSICIGGCLAVTLPMFNGTSIVDADTYANQRLNFKSQSEPGSCSMMEFYIESVMVHEIGHTLGLDHVYKPLTTMYPTISPCMYLRATISSDDARGLAYIY